MIATPTPLKTEPALTQQATNNERLSPDNHRLSQLLQRVRKRARRWILLEAFSAIGFSIAAWFWLTLLLDWLIEPPPGVRILAAGILCFWVVFVLVNKLFLRLRIPLHDEQLALLIERTHPELQDSLSTAIELRLNNTGELTREIDPTLLGRTTSIAAASIRKIRMGRLFRRTQLLRKAGLSSFSIGTMIAVFILLPNVRETWAQRMLMFSNTPWPRQVTLTVADFPNGVRRVARGADTEILVTAQSTGKLPKFVELQHLGANGWTAHRMGTRGSAEERRQLFTHTIKKPKEDLTINVRGGDGRIRDLRLEVVEPPSLKQLVLMITPPLYIGGEPRPLAATRLVEVPAGSTLSITAEASKPLSKATIRSLPAKQQISKNTTGTASSAVEQDFIVAQIEAKPPGITSKNQQNSLSEPPESLSGTLGPILDDSILEIQFTDTAGITSQKPIRFQVIARPDQPPKVEVTPQDISSFITAASSIPITGKIEDDYGLAEAVVSLRRITPADHTEATTNANLQHVSMSLPTQSSTVLDLTKESSTRLGVDSLPPKVGDELELVVSAKDYCGLASGPQTTVTDPWRLRVVSPEVLLAMLEAREIILRRRFESLIADFQQKRDRVASDANTEEQDHKVLTSRLAEATSKANGETTEIAGSFRGISDELFNNRLLNPQLEARLLNQIVTPLETIIEGPLEQLRLASYNSEKTVDAKQLIRMADTCLEQMRAVLDKMIELETYNEVIDSLRNLIEQQQSIRGETSKQQKQRARDVLKGL
ncbi:DUF4175 domain-containing protein [Pirellulales bacterium]|nr:DUF4175 domain-containing protein [Pirellulales bacterium]MDC1301577.1 DUF4175 domain-containing protein [bacterium]